MSVGVSFFPGSRPPLLSPLEIGGCYFWLDASDSGSITTSGGNVTDVADKSTQSNNLTQATSGKRPAYITAAQNGLNVIRFSGGQVLASGSPASTFNAVPGWSVFTVSKAASLTGGQAIFSCQYDSDVTYKVAGNYLNVGVSLAGGKRVKADTAQYQSDTTSRSTTLFQVSASVTTYGSPLTIYLNNVQTAQMTTFQTAGNSDSTNSSLRVGGSSATPGEPFSGDVGEIVVYVSGISDVSRIRLYNYFVAKWGL